jgi:hypothetical protein
VVAERKGVCLLVFLRGVREFGVLERGKSMVILWWIRGDSWTEDEVFLSVENLPAFKNISVDFPFWVWG